MKNLLLFGGILLVLLVGFLFLNSNKDSTIPPTENSTQTSVTGIVVNKDFDQIAFDGPALITILSDDGTGNRVIAIPSMGLPLCNAFSAIAGLDNLAIGDIVSVRGDVDGNGQIVPCAESSHYLTVITLARDSSLGFQFEYRKGPDGYLTIEDRDSTDPDFVTGLTLMNKKEYELLQSSTDAREGPPTMNVRIYTNPENLQAPVWTIRKPRESNIELAIGDTEEAVVGRANAEQYTVDGLYSMETYVVAYGQHVYVLSGAYFEKESLIYEDFQNLVKSFTFISAESI